MEVEAFVNNVDWNPVPIQRAARNVELVRCQPYKPVYGWLISDQPITMLVHWDGQSAWPHLNTKGKCIGCREGMPLRRRGYAALLLGSQPKVRIVEFTDDCLRQDVLLSSSSSHLRGRLVTVKRVASRKDGREHKKSRVTAVWGPLPAPKDLPADFDIRPTLGLIFGLVPNMFGHARYEETEGGAS